MTSADKDRILNHLRSWYRSHSQSVEHFSECGNEKATDYHKKQLQNLEWMAKIIKEVKVDNSNDCPF